MYVLVWTSLHYLLYHSLCWALDLCWLSAFLANERHSFVRMSLSLSLAKLLIRDHEIFVHRTTILDMLVLPVCLKDWSYLIRGNRFLCQDSNMFYPSFLQCKLNTNITIDFLEKSFSSLIQGSVENNNFWFFRNVINRLNKLGLAKVAISM